MKFVTPAMAENRNAGREATALQRRGAAGRQPVPSAALPGQIEAER